MIIDGHPFLTFLLGILEVAAIAVLFVTTTVWALGSPLSF
jgi:hypothetical protein